MCGRYALITDLPTLEAHFDAQGRIDFAPRYNIAPSQQAPVVRQGATGREISLPRWGLIPHWAREPRPNFSTINARAETVAEKPTFRTPFRRSRCLVPATGFYEWKQEGKGQKQPWLLRHRDGLIAFAGLWDRWQRGGQVIDSYSIIVTDANEVVRQIHDRMPVILAPADYGTWLDSTTTLAELQDLLAPCAAESLSLTPVGRYLNSPEHDDPQCLEPPQDPCQDDPGQPYSQAAR